MSNSNLIDDEISLIEIIIKLKKFLSFILAKWKILLIITFTSSLLGYFYAKSQPIKYKASLTFTLDGDKGGGGAIGLASQFGLDLGQNGTGTFEGQNLIELMKSRLLIEKTLLSKTNFNGQETSLAQYFLEINNINCLESGKQILFKPEEDRGGFSIKKDSLLEQIYFKIISNHLSIKQMKKVTFISIEFISENQLFSKIFTESLVTEVSKFYTFTKSKKARINVEILQKQTDSIRNELSMAISGVATLNDNSFLLNPALSIRRVPGLKRQVDVQFNTAILTPLVSNLELAKVNLRKETPLIQIIDSPILPLEKIRVSKSQTILFFAFFAFITSVFLLIILRFIKLI
jgi:uncharacterized protein involved in exopolysaccharide biosynthesis